MQATCCFQGNWRRHLILFPTPPPRGAWESSRPRSCKQLTPCAARCLPLYKEVWPAQTL